MTRVVADAGRVDHALPVGHPRGAADLAGHLLGGLDVAGRAVVGEFNDERIVGRAWPAAENQIVVLDLTR